MKNHDKGRIFVKIIAGVLVGIMVIAMAGTFMYYLIRG